MPAIRGNSYAKCNPGGGAPVGNDNAVGNDGGAPKGNSNAAKHHGWSDPLKHYHRLEGDALTFVDERVENYVEKYALVHELAVEEVEADEEVMDRLRGLAAMDHQWELAIIETFDEGMVIEEEVEYEIDGETRTYTNPKVNPAQTASVRLSQRQRNEREALGISWVAVQEAKLWNGEHQVVTNIDHVETDAASDAATSNTEIAAVETVTGDAAPSDDEIAPSLVAVDQSVEDISHKQDDASAGDQNSDMQSEDDDDGYTGVRTF